MRLASHRTAKGGHLPINAAPDAGAYSYARSFRYTGRSRCQEMLSKGTQAGLMRGREMPDDLTAARKRPAWQQ